MKLNIASAGGILQLPIRHILRNPAGTKYCIGMTACQARIAGDNSSGHHVPPPFANRAPQEQGVENIDSQHTSIRRRAKFVEVSGLAHARPSQFRR
ncbi:MAG TPA: hypothetical protein VHC71_13930 [Hyphomicrobium sp.]|nr:hypothetical protein [Hyphomicrobium sp.]